MGGEGEEVVVAGVKAQRGRKEERGEPSLRCFFSLSFADKTKVKVENWISIPEIILEKPDCENLTGIQ